MPRENLIDLHSVAATARDGSLTRVAASLGVSQPALGHAMSGIETRLELRLLNRTTRSVSTAKAGERLMRVVGPH